MPRGLCEVACCLVMLGACHSRFGVPREDQKGDANLVGHQDSVVGDNDAGSTSDSQGDSGMGAGGDPAVGGGNGNGGRGQCNTSEYEFELGFCEMGGYPEIYEWHIEWEWVAPAGDGGGLHTPMVADLTDDNDDAVVDLSDTPDVVVLASRHIYVLDGATGALHYATNEKVDATPAIGEIDGDCVPEIVSGRYMQKKWRHDRGFRHCRL